MHSSKMLNKVDERRQPWWTLLMCGISRPLCLVQVLHCWLWHTAVTGPCCICSSWLKCIMPHPVERNFRINKDVVDGLMVLAVYLTQKSILICSRVLLPLRKPTCSSAMILFTSVICSQVHASEALVTNSLRPCA